MKIFHVDFASPSVFNAVSLKEKQRGKSKAPSINQAPALTASAMKPLSA